MESGRRAAPAAPAATPAAKKPAAASAEEIDAISEADLFLNFGRDAQAEDVLKEALRKSPGNIPVQLKLLTVYANRKDVNAFTSVARQVKDSGDEAAWEQAAALGRAVDPGNPMYGEGRAEGAPLPIAEVPKPGAIPLDMDIGFNIPMDLDVTAAVPAVEAEPATNFDVSGYVAGSGMDLDVTGGQPAVPEPLLPDFDVTGGHQTAPRAAMDFDVTGSHPHVTEAAGMDFDVTGSHPNMTAGLAMDFDLTGSHPSVAAPLMDFDVTSSHPVVTAGGPGEQMGHIGLGEPLDLNVSVTPPPAAENFAAFGGMDFEISAPAVPSTEAPLPLGGMDFDVSAPAVPSAEAPPPLGGMDFDISAPAAPSAEAPVALGSMDFDISSAAVTEQAQPGAGAAAGMDFDISSIPSPSETPAAAAAPVEFGGMDFDLSAPPPPFPEASPQAGGLGAMDFDISAPPPAQAAKPEPFVDLGLAGLSLDITEAETVVLQREEPTHDERWQEVATKLDLAKAFLEMNPENARELLGEVMKEGDAQQIEAARVLMQQL